MDSLDLIAREDEFKKLNKQLEKKTESLMKQIEHVMHKQDIFSEFSHNLSLTPTHSSKKHTCSKPVQETVNTTPIPSELRRKSLKSPKNVTIVTKNNDVIKSKDCESDNCYINRVVCDCCLNSKSNKRNDDEEFLQAFVSVSIQDKVLPQSFLKDNISVESICKFLSTKVKLMHEQIERLQSIIDKKAIQCKTHLTHQAELEGERMSLLNSNNNLKASAADARAKYAAAEQRLAEKDRLYKEQRSECDKLTCELKRVRSECVGASSRNVAQADAISNLTQQLDKLKHEYSEFRDSTRRLSASHQSTIAKLEAKTKVLSTTIDKQTSLIDNLRKQNAILATEGAVRSLEKEYWNFLSQD